VLLSSSGAKLAESLEEIFFWIFGMQIFLNIFRRSVADILGEISLSTSVIIFLPPGMFVKNRLRNVSPEIYDDGGQKGNTQIIKA
jgi:hypothetical protein